MKRDPKNKNKSQNKAALATQQLLNIKQFVPLRISDDGSCAIEGDDGQLYVYLLLRPDNISVLGRTEILAKIRNLQVVLENVPELQFLCISSTQSYENNKRYYRALAEKAQNPIVARLCVQEIEYLDEINIRMNTSREFIILLTYPVSYLEDAQHSIAQTMQLIREQRFHVRIADKEALKRLFAVYYVGDIYSEIIPNWDGLQYLEEGQNVPIEK